MQVAPSGAGVVDRRQVIQAYRENRTRTRELFEMLAPDAYYERPIPLRHPVVFYDGHIPAFAVNAFLKRGLGHPGVDGDLEVLFARGIDPTDGAAASASAIASWPSRDAVRRYTEQADDAILSALATAPVEGEENAVLRRGQGVFTILEHEEMHQETLLYMWHRLDPRFKRRPAGYEPTGVAEAAPARREMVTIPTGRATLGAGMQQVRFGWDNEFPSLSVEVPAFAIDVHDVTNAEYRAFVDAGGYDDPALWSAAAWRRRREIDRAHPLFWERSDGDWFWRGMFGSVPLPPAWPVYATHDEASAFARWKGLRLPTYAEFHRAAFGTPDGFERAHPWGDGAPDETRGNFDFRSWDPTPVGSFPAGASAWGVHDLAGNGWEWTSTPFAGFPGFEAMASYPEYSADFFDGEHFVVKGASPATARGLVRRSFRNWFRPHYPYAYATFRCAGDAQ
ncbi:MAG: ergothioneine biosynthesis protein EgtB [Acidobacteria bacterium]|nr:ergothioneine biosynthesis protein EgtB [Acidobacteriota bacterium]